MIYEKTECQIGECEMEMFNIIAGVASIFSLLISVISLVKVNDVQKNIKANQQIKNNEIEDSQITQVGGDYNK